MPRAQIAGWPSTSYPPSDRTLRRGVDLECLDPRTGAARFRMPFTGACDVGEGVVVQRGPGDTLTARDARTGEVRFTTPTRLVRVWAGVIWHGTQRCLIARSLADGRELGRADLVPEPARRVRGAALTGPGRSGSRKEEGRPGGSRGRPR